MSTFIDLGCKTRRTTCFNVCANGEEWGKSRHGLCIKDRKLSFVTIINITNFMVHSGETLGKYYMSIKTLNTMITSLKQYRAELSIPRLVTFFRRSSFLV